MKKKLGFINILCPKRVFASERTKYTWKETRFLQEECFMLTFCHIKTTEDVFLGQFSPSFGETKLKPELRSAWQDQRCFLNNKT